MTDEAGAAAAAAEPLMPGQGADGAAAQPDDGGSEPQAQPVKPSARAAIDRAFAEIEKQEEETERRRKQDAAAGPGRDGQGRDAQGRFKAGDAQPDAGQHTEEQPKTPDETPAGSDKASAIGEAPSRFSADARAAWAAVPDAVKGEVHRAFREMESGLKDYQKVFEPLKPYFQLAQKHETTVHDTLGRYVSLDMQLLSEDPAKRMSAIQEVLEYAGMSPQDYAALVSGQKPDQAQAESAAVIRQLKGDLAQLREMVGGVSTSIRASRQSQIESEVVATVEAFAKDHPRLDDAEFVKTVSRLIETRMADSLESAYDMAERLIPAPVAGARPAASSAATQKPADQTRKGTLSIAGAPVSGSNPAKRKPSSSARESLDRAFAEMGL